MQPMHPQHEHVVHTARQLVEAALGPWGGTAACIDAYEAAVRSAAEAHATAARAAHLPPARSIAALYANLTRDVGAVQVSTARWFLDV
jgi:hypothetical protein